MTHHDTPSYPLPPMRYVDASAEPGEQHTYTVVSINNVVHEIGRIEATPFELNTTNGECIVFPATAGRNYRVEPKAL